MIKAIKSYIFRDIVIGKNKNINKYDHKFVLKISITIFYTSSY